MLDGISGLRVSPSGTATSSMTGPLPAGGEAPEDVEPDAGLLERRSRGSPATNEAVDWIRQRTHESGR